MGLAEDADLLVAAARSYGGDLSVASGGLTVDL